MYHYRPVQEYECEKIQRALHILKGVITREGKRHQMDEHLTHSMRSLLEDEIIPQLENELEMDYDPSPYYLWDNSGGEPPVTLDEMHTQSYKREHNL